MKELDIVRRALVDARQRESWEEFFILLRGIETLYALMDLAAYDTAELECVA